VHDPSYMIGRSQAENGLEEMKEIPEIHRPATKVRRKNDSDGGSSAAILFQVQATSPFHLGHSVP
jgi:hypothetical protein